MISRHLVKYILVAAMRDKLMVTLALMIVLGAAIAVFMGAATITENESFLLVFSSGGLRFLGVIGVVLFSCFYVRRSFDSKEVEFLLSRPISREAFLVSHALAFSILSFIIAAFIYVVILVIGNPDSLGTFVWAISIASEIAIMSVVSLFFSMVLSSASGSALAALGFYALSRMIGTVLGIVTAAPGGWGMSIMNNTMELISVIIPRFDIMGQTSWLIYGVEEAVGLKFMPNAGVFAQGLIQHIGLSGFILSQFIIFMTLLLTASFYDFNRRQF